MVCAVTLSWVSCCAWVQQVLDSTCVCLVTPLGKSYSLHKAFGWHRKSQSPELGIWQDKLFLGVLQLVLDSSFGKYCQSFWPQEPFSSQTVKNNNPESECRTTSMIQEEKGRPWNTFQSAVSACYLWLSGKVAGKILWNWALFHAWLLDSQHGSQQNCINRKAANQLRNKPYGSELSCALPTRGSRSICHLRCNLWATHRVPAKVRKSY